MCSYSTLIWRQNTLPGINKKILAVERTGQDQLNYWQNLLQFWFILSLRWGVRKAIWNWITFASNLAASENSLSACYIKSTKKSLLIPKCHNVFYNHQSWLGKKIVHQEALRDNFVWVHIHVLVGIHHFLLYESIKMKKQESILSSSQTWTCPV